MYFLVQLCSWNVSGFYLFEFADVNEKGKPRAAFFHFGNSIHLLPDRDIHLSDIKFYNNDILSVLLSCGGDSSVFLQFCVSLLREELVPVTSHREFTSPDFAFVPSVLRPSNVRSVDASAYIEPNSFRLFQDFQVCSVKFHFPFYCWIFRILDTQLEFLNLIFRVFSILRYSIWNVDTLMFSRFPNIMDYLRHKELSETLICSKLL